MSSVLWLSSMSRIDKFGTDDGPAPKKATKPRKICVWCDHPARQYHLTCSQRCEIMYLEDKELTRRIAEEDR